VEALKRLEEVRALGVGALDLAGIPTGQHEQYQYTWSKKAVHCHLLV
jgi:hypothetical protein